MLKKIFLALLLAFFELFALSRALRKQVCFLLSKTVTASAFVPGFESANKYLLFACLKIGNFYSFFVITDVYMSWSRVGQTV